MSESIFYNQLVENIGIILRDARDNAVRAVNSELVLANWTIGKYIVEYEQKGNERAEYGSRLLNNLSSDLKMRFGKGFSRSNLQLMRLFYIKYTSFQKSQTVSGKSLQNKILSWSHYAELLTVSDDLARGFYEHQALAENWSLRDMKRQMDAALFQRLAISKNKKEIAKLSVKGHTITHASDIIKDPYIFEFLKIPAGNFIKEKSLERKLIDNLQKFLLELGKGFSFVARQFALNIDNQHFYIDIEAV